MSQNDRRRRSISSQNLIILTGIASISFSMDGFSASGPTGVHEHTMERIQDRADQVKKGDVDARRISEELGKPTPDVIEDNAESTSNIPGKKMNEGQSEADSPIRTAPE